MQQQVAKYVTGQLHLKNSFDTWHGKEKQVLGGIISFFSEQYKVEKIFFITIVKSGSIWDFVQDILQRGGSMCMDHAYSNWNKILD